MRPTGSRHPFGLSQSLKPYLSPLQSERSLFPVSSTLSAVPLPYGRDTAKGGANRAYPVDKKEPTSSGWRLRPWPGGITEYRVL
jgi:hypothetical protein